MSLTTTFNGQAESVTQVAACTAIQATRFVASWLYNSNLRAGACR
jgi:hypothetical protein